MGNSYLGRLLSIISGITVVLAASNTVHAQCKVFFFDSPTYTTSGGTQGAGSIVGQDGWTLLSGTPTNAKMSIVNLGAGAYSSTQALKITVSGNNISEATKTFTACSTTTNTGLISVRMKYKKGLVGPAGTIIKPIVLDDLGNNFGFFQIYGNGMMKGRGGTNTDVNTDEFDPDNFPGNGFPINGWHDLEMRLNPSPNSIVDPGSGITIDFGKLLYLCNGNVIPATGITGAMPNANPMVYYGGSNTSGKVGRFTLRYETTSLANESCYLDNWEVWIHPRPIAKAKTFTVQLNASGTATITGLNIDNGSVGGDPNQTITDRTANPFSFTCSNIGSNNVTLTVTQSDGQTASTVTTVTVQDTVVPSINSCGANQSTNANANCQGTVPNFTSGVIATDNCTAAGSLTKTQSPTVGTVVNSGITVVTITVKDAQNNQSQCTRNFTVNTPDTDGDSTPDCSDNCDNDPNKIDPGLCGCGVADTDTDGDSTPDCTDGCDNDPDKIAPGLCGCGVADTDTDGDSTPDCTDGCDNDPDKIAPGVCGCGVAETDTDGDLTPDCIDGCDNDPAKILPGLCGCGVPEGSCERTITQWSSVRTHTGMGELSIVLNATATGDNGTGPTIETRGTNTAAHPTASMGVQKVQVNFDGPITLANAANITVTYWVTTPGAPATMGGPTNTVPSLVELADADTLDILFDPAQIPNMSCINIDIGAGTLVETVSGDTDCNIRSLACDTNGDGKLTISDQNQTKGQNGQTLPPAQRFDFNMSGGITVADQSFARSQNTSPQKTALCP